MERLAFEMDKRYEETKLQVLLSPALLIAKDQYQVLFADVCCLYIDLGDDLIDELPVEKRHLSNLIIICWI